MNKEGDLLEFDLLDEKINQKKKVDDDQKVLQEGIASPASKLVSSRSRNSVMDRTIKRRDERRELEQQISSLRDQLRSETDTLTLTMPISKTSVKFKKMLIEPSLIDVSDENQRVQSLLDMASVSDIYDSILHEGQSEPGFVREKDNGRYELVSGSRRLFCVKNIKNRMYLALVGLIPDVDVRRLSRLENQQSPISVFERALSFKQDIISKKVKSWDALAVLEGLSDRQIKKYKALSELPIEIVRSFSSPSDLSLEFADWIISKLRKDHALRRKFTDMAVELIAEKVDRTRQDIPKRSAQDVMALYKSAVRIKPASPTSKKPQLYKVKDGKGVVRYSISSKGSHKMEFIDIPEAKMNKAVRILLDELGFA